MTNIKRTTKPRKKLFYNKLTEALFIETEIGSNQFRNEDKEEINIDVITHSSHIYIDLSLFPAHIYKNYGCCNALDENKLVWYFESVTKNETVIKPKLIFVTAIVSDFRGNYTITYRQVDPSGVLETKNRVTSVYAEFLNSTFREVRENYQIKTTIKLL